ncbi:hypothetical protein RND81_04G178600 [Saponaria officinalis]|uniref:Histidine-containing phosphotransfer protein n=1 Tax=Saponaria officinalis TaxID=3572 RepID=A0AAW1LN01_SAPOF
MAAGSKESLLRTMDAIITELEQEGLINKYFRLSSQLKEVNGPYFFANLLLTFISDTHNALMEIAKLLDEEFVNFDALDQIAIKLKGSASCIGLVCISRACANLRCGIDVKSHIGLKMKSNTSSEGYMQD